MEREGIISTGIIVLILALLGWFWFSLFHYNHKYKVYTRQHTTGILFSNNEYDIADKVVVSNVGGEYRVFDPSFTVPSDTVTITKILR